MFWPLSFEVQKLMELSPQDLSYQIRLVFKNISMISAWFIKYYSILPWRQLEICSMCPYIFYQCIQNWHRIFKSCKRVILRFSSHLSFYVYSKNNPNKLTENKYFHLFTFILWKNLDSVFCLNCVFVF